jgi:peptidoglycan/LPS O-acetylase OafA/YrhL
VISYGIFLWHEPLILWLRDRSLTAGGILGLVANVVLVLGLTVACSALTYRYVEAPAMRLRRRRVGGDSEPPLPAATDASAAP